MWLRSCFRLPWPRHGLAVSDDGCLSRLRSPHAAGRHCRGARNGALKTATLAICSFNRDEFLSRDRNASACRALCDMDRLFLSITAVSLIVLVTTISLGPVSVSEQLAASMGAFLH